LERGVDAHTTALLSYAGGATAALHATLVAQTTNEAVIYGEKGNITITAPLYRPHQIKLQATSGGAALPDAARSFGGKEKLMQHGLVKQLFFKLALPLKSVIGGGGYKVTQPWQGNGYNYEAAEAVRCIKAGLIESPLMPHQDTIAVMRVADALAAGRV
jgi:predicted dehydrogenase